MSLSLNGVWSPPSLLRQVPASLVFVVVVVLLFARGAAQAEGEDHGEQLHGGEGDGYADDDGQLHLDRVMEHVVAADVGVALIVVLIHPDFDTLGVHGCTSSLIQDAARLGKLTENIICYCCKH